MSIVDEKFRRVRSDQTPYLFHFMRGTAEHAKDTLLTILKEECLRSPAGYICFTASPVTALLDFFKTPKASDGQPMYQPFGIGFSRDILIKDFKARNVIYAGEEELERMPGELRWRSLKLEVGRYDFEYLREWRLPKGEFNFADFPKDDMIILAPTIQDLNDLIVYHDVEFCPIVNYETGDVDPDFNEVFIRAYKGMTLMEAAELKNDYALLGSATSQKIGEDMFEDLLASHFFWGDSTREQ